MILHYTAMCTADDALERLCDPVHEVSAHYLIDRAGRVCSLVTEDARAWHAGAGAWGACRDVNSASIGIELDNDGSTPFPEPQMAALEQLLKEIMGRWRIPPAGVLGHEEIAPGRKSDPGPKFDWRRLGLSGLAVLPDVDPAPGLLEDRPPQEAVDALLREAGYTAEAPFEARLEAFRRRYLPRSEGPANGADRLMLIGLLNAYGLDGSSTGS